MYSESILREAISICEGFIVVLRNVPIIYFSVEKLKKNNLSIFFSVPSVLKKENEGFSFFKQSAFLL